MLGLLCLLSIFAYILLMVWVVAGIYHQYWGESDNDN